MSEDNSTIIHLVASPAPDESEFRLDTPGRIIDFQFTGGRLDLVDGIKHYLSLFENGFDFLYSILEKNQTAFRAFPNHRQTFINKYVQEPPQGIYLATLIEFERLVARLIKDSRVQESAHPAFVEIAAFQVFTQAKALAAYRDRFEASKNKFTSCKEIFLLYNPELRCFGETVQESSLYLRTISKAIDGLIPLLIPSVDPPCQALDLEHCLAPVSSDRKALIEEISAASTKRANWIRYVSSIYTTLHSHRENLFTAWKDLIWEGVKRVYTPGGIELELDARLIYRQECEREGRFILGLEYYQRILEKLNPGK